MENNIEPKSVFLSLFGDYPLNRVLDFLVIHQEFDYAMKEIADKSGIGYSTLKLFWKQLIKRKIVVLTRELGRAKLYKLNKNNEIVKNFEKFYWTITKSEIRKELNKEIEA